jgi:hypothetical protein
VLIWKQTIAGIVLDVHVLVMLIQNVVMVHVMVMKIVDLVKLTAAYVVNVQRDRSLTVMVHTNAGQNHGLVMVLLIALIRNMALT